MAYKMGKFSRVKTPFPRSPHFMGTPIQGGYIRVRKNSIYTDPCNRPSEESVY